MHHIIDLLTSPVSAEHVVAERAIAARLKIFRTNAIAGELYAGVRDEPSGGRTGWNSC